MTTSESGKEVKCLSSFLVALLCCGRGGTAILPGKGPVCEDGVVATLEFILVCVLLLDSVDDVTDEVVVLFVIVVPEEADKPMAIVVVEE